MITTSALSMESAAADMGPLGESSLPPTFFSTATAPGVHAVTDRSRIVPLMRYEAVSILPAGRQLSFESADEHQRFLRALEQKFLANTNQDPKTVYKLVEPFPAANCHGWILTGGQYGVCDTLLLSILEDNGYVATENVQHGDIVVFSNAGQVKHSGVVRIDASGSLFVESKWGPFGVYLHGIDTHPFAKAFAFYRSSRNGHLLTIVEGKAESGR
jgi:hypothetical protein